MEGSSPQRQTTVENESDNSLFQRDFSNLGSSVDDIKESVRSCEVQHRELQRHMERLLNVTADLKNKLMEKEAQIKKLMEENARLRGPCDCWMQIFVKSSLSGKTITLDVKRTNTIDDVNAMIQRKEGIPRNRRTTSFYVMFGGKRLEGERTVAHYNIEKGSTLHFVGRFIDIPQIAVSVSNSNGKGITLYPTVINTIDDLKLMIEDKTGIPVDEQMLRFGVAGQQLEGSRKLLDCCIYDGSFIYLEPCKHSGTVEVCVLNLSLKRFMLEVDSFDKIGHLKGIIRREEGLRPDGDRSFDLVFNGNVLDEDRTIGSYKIVGKSQIHIVLKEAGGGGADVPV